MVTNAQSPFPFPPPRVYQGAKIPLRVIRRFAQAIAAEFRPDRIVMFGSHAYGVPHEESDVDLLVVMRTRDPYDQAVRIRSRLAAPFPLDLMVCSPREVARRLREHESFMTEVMTRGETLYEKDDEEVGQKSGARLRPRAPRESK